MYTYQVHFKYKQFSVYRQLLYGFQCPLEICLNVHSFELFICGHSAPYTSVHSCVRDTFWLMQERSKIARGLEPKVICLVWLVLNEVFVKKAENDSPFCFSWLGMSLCYLTSISVLLICTFTTVFT
jgi:hypothetical protein